MKYFALFGLGGGFGGIQHCHLIEASTLEEAQDYAYHEACEIYESYDGMYGLRTVEAIMEEDDLDEKSAQTVWEEERESWLDYRAEPFDESKVERYEALHYEDRTI